MKVLIYCSNKPKLPKNMTIIFIFPCSTGTKLSPGSIKCDSREGLNVMTIKVDLCFFRKEPQWL